MLFLTGISAVEDGSYASVWFGTWSVQNHQGQEVQSQEVIYLLHLWGGGGGVYQGVESGY